MHNDQVFTLKIGGQAGQGVKSTGLMFAKIATRSGLNIYTYTEYPSLIRGGHNLMQINASLEEVTAPATTCDLLVAFDQETIDRHHSELVDGGGILFDQEKEFNTTKVSKKINLYPVPLSQLAGQDLLSNSVALGVVVALLGANFSVLQDLIGEEFAVKGAKIIAGNKKAARAGFDFAKEHFSGQVKQTLNFQGEKAVKVIVNGNEAMALGAIAAGMQFASIYPMTPITGMLQVFASYQEKFNFIYQQPEDEIAAINMAVGSSFAGARSLVATSGGGFCLMTEGYGLAAMAEIPLVVVLGMRPGPATGLPTWSDQGDLGFVLHAHQGDFPQIVLAAGDAQEAFFLTMEAFNLADKYQTPVVVLVDKNICENDQSFPLFDVSTIKFNRGKLITKKKSSYQRFVLEADGISERTFPGTGNFFIANSYEHDVIGFSSDEVDDRNQQMKKRMTKLETCAKVDMPKPQVFGPKDADLTLVSWGSNKGSILEAIKNFPNVNFLYLSWMNPFPAEAVREILKNSRHLVDIECNYIGQLAELIRDKTGIDISDKILKVDGRPFFPKEIEEEINNILNK